MSTLRTPRDYNVGGFYPTGIYRLRPTWLFGLLVAEEKIEHRDGRVTWKRVRWPSTLALSVGVDTDRVHSIARAEAEVTFHKLTQRKEVRRARA
jgi:hypothetical protein